MKKKNILYALIGVLFLTLFFGITKVNAEEYVNQAIWNGEFIDNVYIKKFRSDGTIKSEQGRFMRRSEDNKFVYCLQPYVGIDNNLPWYQIARSDFETVLNMTKEQWNRISLLAYYGYYYDRNIDKAMTDFKRVLNGESLADTFSNKERSDKLCHTR